MMRRAIFLFFFYCIFSVLSYSQEKEEVINKIYLVNDFWQQRSPKVWSFWEEAAYHTGNMEAYFLTGKEEYKAYSENWAEYNNWMGATSTDKPTWKYSYGETNQYVLFGDWQICFQTYIDLYNLDKEKEPRKIARALEVMSYQMNTPNNDYWWWVDGLYMVMPVMTKLYKLTQNELYLDKLYEYFEYADNLMYDKEEHLYYRDAKYIYPKHTSINGKKDFWARGNGWAFAAFAKVLSDLPTNNPHRNLYITRYMEMAEAVKATQQEEGYWVRSLLDAQHAPGYETSGTAFFTYGLFWGINNGYLDKAEYLPVAIKSWNYLQNIALQNDGSIGYVQPIGEKAIPGQTVDSKSTANFGVGAFLLAACEYVRYLDTPKEYAGWKLIWNDEFNTEGKPDSSFWNYENGFKRNYELQWYQEENVYCKGGNLVIEARREKRQNPYYDAKSKDWRKEREYIEYTSSSINTRDKKEFEYGRFEVRAKIPTQRGAWPAIWTLGKEMEWPSSGEIDIMEYYQIDGQPHILANFAWGTDKRYDAKWKSKAIPYDVFLEKDKNWGDKFHIWRMDWDKDYIRLYIDDELVNEVEISETKNGKLGKEVSPFTQPHYFLLNLAIGGQHGGDPSESIFPLKYEIDYVRVYQK